VYPIAFIDAREMGQSKSFFGRPGGHIGFAIYLACLRWSLTNGVILSAQWFAGGPNLRLARNVLSVFGVSDGGRRLPDPPTATDPLRWIKGGCRVSVGTLASSVLVAQLDRPIQSCGVVLL
jgi:hypothetical protein